jgi:putative restriction endonuclease
MPDGTIFGTVNGHKVGDYFLSRKQMHDLGLHRMLMHGIASHGSSIVLSGGYADDEDHGDYIIYTGEGGRDSETGRQVADQQLTGGNKALADNHRNGIPVRVFRGRHHITRMPEPYRYRYDGLYNINRYWSEVGQHGFKVWRFRLEKSDEDVETGSGSEAIDGESQPVPTGEENPIRKEGRTTRVVRSTEVVDHVKNLYEFVCQSCEVILKTPAGPYSEGCHIKPLGRPHNGPDVISNVLCLCPNCHVLFDEGAIWLDSDLNVMPGGKKLKQASSHMLDAACIQYHRSLWGIA